MGPKDFGWNCFKFYMGLMLPAVAASVFYSMFVMFTEKSPPPVVLWPMIVLQLSIAAGLAGLGLYWLVQTCHYFYVFAIMAHRERKFRKARK